MSAIEKLSEGRHARRRIFGPLGGPPAASTPLVVTGLFQGYLAYNMARKALAVAAPGLQGDEGLSKTDLGVVSSSFTVTYGASKFAGSVITDHVSCRALFSLGLVLTGVLCLIFSLSSELPRLCLLWSLHGVVQGAGWPSLAKICVERVAPRAQGRVWALLSAAGNAGHVCAGPLLLSLGGGWRRVMQGAGILALLSGGLAWMLTGGDDDAADEKDGWFLKARKEGEEGREILLPWSTNQDWRAAVAKGVEWIFVVKRILRPEVAALFLADSLIYFVIKGLADWSVLVLTETKGTAAPPTLPARPCVPQPPALIACLHRPDREGGSGRLLLLRAWSHPRVFRLRLGVGPSRRPPNVHLLRLFSPRPPVPLCHPQDAPSWPPPPRLRLLRARRFRQRAQDTLRHRPSTARPPLDGRHCHGCPGPRRASGGLLGRCSCRFCRAALGMGCHSTPLGSLPPRLGRSPLRPRAAGQGPPRCRATPRKRRAIDETLQLLPPSRGRARTSSQRSGGSKGGKGKREGEGEGGQKEEVGREEGCT